MLACHLHALEVAHALGCAVPQHKFQLALTPQLAQPVILPEAPYICALYTHEEA